jgi:hypothetical protein
LADFYSQRFRVIEPAAVRMRALERSDRVQRFVAPAELRECIGFPVVSAIVLRAFFLYGGIEDFGCAFVFAAIEVSRCAAENRKSLPGRGPGAIAG